MSDQFETQETGNNQEAESLTPEAESQEPNLQAESQEPQAESRQSGVAFHAARCQHIKVNGTQCGSPALKDKQFCHFHSQCRPAQVKSEGFIRDGEILLPAFEDATSIQFTLRQVMQLVLERKMEEHTARLLLYALQIASSNLKQMQAEKPRPTQVVIDPEKVAETPIGMTPWTTRRDGQPELENEEADSATIDIVQRVKERWQKEYRDCKEWLAEKAAEMGQCLEEKPEPSSERLLQALGKAKAEVERAVRLMEQRLPPVKIQACVEDEGYVPGEIQASAETQRYIV